MKRITLALLGALLLSTVASAAENYTVDPKHTFPSYEIAHMGLTTQRGRFNATSGTIIFDKAAKTGSVEIEIDAASVSTGLPDLEKHLKSEDFFDVTKFPRITFKSTKVNFEGETPKSVEGELTMHGVTRPVNLAISSFNCITHPMSKKYVCGADASTTIQRSDFGIRYGIPMVSDNVKLLIQIEAVRKD